MDTTTYAYGAAISMHGRVEVWRTSRRAAVRDANRLGKTSERRHIVVIAAIADDAIETQLGDRITVKPDSLVTPLEVFEPTQRGRQRPAHQNGMK